jgi:hypothetical protein
MQTNVVNSVWSLWEQRLKSRLLVTLLNPSVPIVL